MVSGFAMTPRVGNLFLMKDRDDMFPKPGRLVQGDFLKPELFPEYFNWFCESAVKMKECSAKYTRMPVG